jgi:type I restriction enzyme M protein
VVERPLRLNFQCSAERIERLKEQAAFRALATSKKKGAAGVDEIESGCALQRQILVTLTRLDATRVYKARSAFESDLAASDEGQGGKMPPAVARAVLAALSERDETAEVCRDAKGCVEADADLRDYENVPLNEDIHEYFKREVRPHVPDAWIDETKTKVGYEIPLTRQFYKYQPLRALAEIEEEIRMLETEIQGMLGEVLG